MFVTTPFNVACGSCRYSNHELYTASIGNPDPYGDISGFFGQVKEKDQVPPAPENLVFF
ncbi:hypothetical protein [Paenibacillus chitinolyticus]|uniref:Uncharacterized protein n=1 Tax=Paenibacillus chitinolyticus TaxID=79263 RepID=A0ABT4FAB0_9BACL|nr:hypothetical protein [Paenibacillus chitinolyticus]MCY9589004.1 hypothetical protein [Paenibacillus chitinolyticus]MCY9595458.1 hypothetical protein [Paenibacillus chitinolyticus]